MNTNITDKLIARYVAKGGNADDGRDLLAEQIRTLSADNLATALVYWNFATEATADKYAAALAA